MKKQLFATGFFLFSFMLPFKATAASFTGINVFGDSLVDTGNLFNFAGIPPSPPYDHGRFSNGSIWVDNLAQQLDLTPTLFTELGSTLPTEGINFAFGGATVTGDNNSSPPGLQQQIGFFKDITTIAPADPNALYILWAGGNDYNGVFFNPPTIPPELLPNQVTSNLSMAVQSLFDLGARNFLIPNLPDLGETPLAHNLNQLFPSASSQLSALTEDHNLLLEQKIDNLKVLPGINITTLDVNSLVRDAMNNPMEFGFTNVQNSCLTNFKPGFNFEGVCGNPDGFLFWDDVHPTAASHKFISQLAIETLKEEEPASVPEPASALSLLAFGALGVGAMVKHKDKKEGAIKRL